MTDPTYATSLREVDTLNTIVDNWLKGYSIEKTALSMSLDHETVQRLLDKAVSNHSSYYTIPSSTEHFVRIATFQLGVISKLDVVYSAAMASDNNKNLGAAVSALKAQADIYDRIQDRGVKAGIITQDGDGDMSDLARLTPEESKKQLVAYMVQLASMLKSTSVAQRDNPYKRSHGLSNPRDLTVIEPFQGEGGSVYAYNYHGKEAPATWDNTKLIGGYIAGVQNNMRVQLNLKKERELYDKMTQISEEGLNL